MLAAHAPVEVLPADGWHDVGGRAVEELQLDVTLDGVAATHAQHLLLAPAQTEEQVIMTSVCAT